MLPKGYRRWKHAGQLAMLLCLALYAAVLRSAYGVPWATLAGGASFILLLVPGASGAGRPALRRLAGASLGFGALLALRAALSAERGWWTFAATWSATALCVYALASGSAWYERWLRARQLLVSVYQSRRHSYLKDTYTISVLSGVLVVGRYPDGSLCCDRTAAREAASLPLPPGGGVVELYAATPDQLAQAEGGPAQQAGTLASGEPVLRVPVPAARSPGTGLEVVLYQLEDGRFIERRRFWEQREQRAHQAERKATSAPTSSSTGEPARPRPGAGHSPARFDAAAQAWAAAPAATQDQRRTSLTCATYNIWFGSYYAHERHAALLELLQAHSPDIIALQEVRRSALRHILAQPWIRQRYLVSDSSGGTLGRYGLLLLSRIPLERVTTYRLPSLMGRRLLVATFHCNGQTIAVATTHLESTRLFAPVRALQLARSFHILARYPHVIFMGDFNFCASSRENRRLDPGYIDLWSSLRPGQPGYTQDSDINVMQLQQHGRRKQARFDRVLLRSAAPGWRPQSIDILGTRPIGPEHPELFPSDHFGLLARLSWT